MPMNDGEPVFSKYPSDIMVKFKARGKYIWVPFTGTSFDVTKEMTAEHYSGDSRPVNITEGNVDYKGTLETGWIADGIPTEWLDQGVTQLDAENWEHLLRTFLINPSNQGRSIPFDIEYHEREYTGVILESGTEQVVGGGIWAAFMGAKLNHHTFNSSEGSLAKRTYEWIARRAKWGTVAEV